MAGGEFRCRGGDGNLQGTTGSVAGITQVGCRPWTQISTLKRRNNTNPLATSSSRNRSEAMPYHLKGRNVLITGASRYTIQVIRDTCGVA